MVFNFAEFSFSLIKATVFWKCFQVCEIFKESFFNQAHVI